MFILLGRNIMKCTSFKMFQLYLQINRLARDIFYSITWGNNVVIKSICAPVTNIMCRAIYENTDPLNCHQYANIPNKLLLSNMFHL